MRHFTMPALLALVVPALVGCPSIPNMAMGRSYPPPEPVPYPMPYPTPMPMMTSAPIGGAIAPIPSLLADGPSMDDAYHSLNRYVTLHYPGAELVAVRSTQVGLPGRIAKAGSWSFTYRMPCATTASPSATIQAVTIPSQFEGRQLTFTLNGNNELFAPEVKEKTALAAIDYAQVLTLGKVLELCQGFGMAIGPGGISATLLSDAQSGPFYEIDNSIGYQWASPSPNGYGPYYSNSSVRRKYRIDARSGALLESLTP